MQNPKNIHLTNNRNVLIISYIILAWPLMALLRAPNIHLYYILLTCFEALKQSAYDRKNYKFNYDLITVRRGVSERDKTRRAINQGIEDDHQRETKEKSYGSQKRERVREGRVQKGFLKERYQTSSWK